MNLLIPLSGSADQTTTSIGGKAFALARLQGQGFSIPDSFCLPTAAYLEYLSSSGLAAMIDMELGRKNFADMRWEEIWDTALRIRNLFLRTPLPETMEQQLHSELARQFGSQPVVVRSSAPGEDSAAASFAGLHESIVNLQGAEQIIEGIRQVWASLWSDRALLYRQELALDPQRSSMSVLLQELTDSEKSGVAFSVNPNNSQQAVIEAVWGLNQGLVDGSIQPDQWLFQRATGRLQLHLPAQRGEQLKPSATGVTLRPLSREQITQPPLTEQQSEQVFALVMQLEEQFGCPQDCEWTFADQKLILLQSRPTTRKFSEQDEDNRQGFLNLHRSFAELQNLQKKIEGQLLPAMENDAARLALLNPKQLDNQQLAREISQRRQLMKDWEASYIEYCIPMAHGVRLFGQLYNDRLKPADPFEFIALLQRPGFRAIQRNSSLQEFAEKLLSESASGSAVVHQQLTILRRDYGLPDIPDEMLLALLHQFATRQSSDTGVTDKRDELEKAYSAAFPAGEQTFAAEVLELARASYRLRDDDNISMGKIRQQLEAAEAEAKRRLQGQDDPHLQALFAEQKQEQFHPASRGRSEPDANRFLSSLGRISFRQLQGQPAGPGIASGTARVVREEKDLWQVKRGEVLVCDAIDPTMTFVVPLAAAIVERRGGMLIHGAIIAREYGIPCVTGVVDAAERIQTGDRVTVDGYLGLIILTQQSNAN